MDETGKNLQKRKAGSVVDAERGKMFAIILLIVVLLKGEENKQELWTDANIQNVTNLHIKFIIVYGHELRIEQ